MTVIFRLDAQVVAFERTEERNDPEIRPTDLIARALVRIDIFARHNAMREKEDRFFINKKVNVLQFRFVRSQSLS